MAPFPPYLRAGMSTGPPGHLESTQNLVPIGPEMHPWPPVSGQCSMTSSPSSTQRHPPKSVHKMCTQEIVGTFFTSQCMAGEGSGKETSEYPDRSGGCRRKDQLHGDPLVERIDNRYKYVKRNKLLM